MKNKDDNWYDEKVQKIKKAKRTICKPISENSYGVDFAEGKLTNKKIKEIKEDLKREKRAAKRSSKQFLDKEIKEQINKRN